MPLTRWIALGLGLLAAATMAVFGQERKPMVDITEIGPSGQPIIFWRIENGEQDAVKALVEAGMSTEVHGFMESTPVIAAGSANLWTTVMLLLELGADPMAANRNGMTLAWLVKTARINPESPDGLARLEVAAFLKARNAATVYEPKEVKTLRAAGQWPPA